MRYAFLLNIFILFFSPQAYAFTVTIANVFGYDTDTVVLHINPSNCPSSIAADTEAAIVLWNSAPYSGLILVLGTNTSSAVSTFKSYTFTDTQIVIGCSTDFNSDKSSGCDAACLESTIAVGGAASLGGNLIKGKVVINMNSGVGGNYGGLSSNQKQIVLAHELGHALGLGHTEDIPALMYYNISAKENLALSQDDIDGITYMYSRDELGQHLPFGCGSLRAQGTTNIFYLFFLLLPIALVFFIKLIKSTYKFPLLSSSY